MEVIMNGIGKDEDIKELEEKIQMKLPEDYKEFLRQTNGGQMKNRNNYLKFEGIEEKITVTRFFGVTIQAPVVTSLYRLLDFYKERRGKFFEGMLPIAYTYGGHCVVIFYQNEKEEGYYLLDWSLFHKELTPTHYLYKIADTFDELLNNIVEM